MPSADEPHVFVIGPCISCHQPFTFHPNLVPSAVVNGVREPICRSCVERANPERERRGLPLITILPGAYDPAPESSINWEG